jgi:hypothetical protein
MTSACVSATATAAMSTSATVLRERRPGGKREDCRDTERQSHD